MTIHSKSNDLLATSNVLLESYVALVSADQNRAHGIFSTFESQTHAKYDQQSTNNILPASIGEIALSLLDRTYKSQFASDTVARDFIRSLMDHNIVPALTINPVTNAIARQAFVESLQGTPNRYVYVNGVLQPSQSVMIGMDFINFLQNESNLIAIEERIDLNLAKMIYTYAVSKILLKTADICTSMTLEAIRGETSAFDSRLHELGRPYPGQIATARNIRRLIEQSEQTTEEARIAFGGDAGPRCQDAISIRAVPQTHGAVRDAHAWLGEVISGELEFVPRKASPITGYAVDLLAIALIDLGNMSERRTARLLDSKTSYGLPMNLMAENPGFNHGFPVIQAAASAILAEIKLKAPKGYGQSRFNQITGQYNPFELESSTRLLELLPLLRKILAIETYMSAQAMDLCKKKLTGNAVGLGTRSALSKIREYISLVRENRFASKDMAVAEMIVEYGLLVRAVEDNIGQLD